jgi:large subunit ribosomal protein L18
MNSQEKVQSYLKRKRRTNATIKAQMPEYRCVVVRSLKHIRAQLIDAKGCVVATATDLALKTGTKSERAFEVGKALAKLAAEKKVSSCAFDRNGFLYHGRVKSLCEGMREGGMTL